MVSLQLEIVSKQFIKPSNTALDSLKRHLKLSFLNQVQYIVGTYISLIFFYENDNAQFSSKIDPLKRSHQLKQSLSEALTKFYPFAGRLNQIPTFDCNDSGALYVEARVNAPLLEVLVQNATPNDLNMYIPIKDISHLPFYERSDDVLLAVQVTYFDCGGMAIGVCLSHIIADFCSFVMFMNEWAQKCNSTIDQIFNNIKPNFELGLTHFPPVEMTPELFGLPKDINPKEYHPPPAEEENRVMKRFVFDKNMLSTMKCLVSPRSTCYNPTRVEIVSAFIWKHLVDISKAKSQDTKREYFLVHTVNMRPIITSSLPKDEFAATNFSACTQALWDLDNGRDYCNLVPLIRRAIRYADHNFLQEESIRIASLESLARRQPEKECHVLTSWCRFPYYQLDFGWGKPLSVCAAPCKLFKNVGILMDTRSGDGIEAWINMAEDDYAMLSHDFLALENNDFVDQELCKRWKAIQLSDAKEK